MGEAVGAADPADTPPPPGADELLDAADHLAEHPEVFETLSVDDLAELLSMVFVMAAVRRGDHWKLQTAERDRLAKWFHRVLEKRGMEWLGEWLPEIMAGSFLFYAVAKRLQLDAVVVEAVEVE